MTSKDKMKSPQQIRNEVEKEIEECKEGITNNIAKGYYYDGWNIELKKAEAKLSILTEYDKSIKEMIENLDLEKFLDMFVRPTKLSRWRLDTSSIELNIKQEILTKIGGKE
jgi:hypothetical protein